MSAKQTFDPCIDCWEMHYGIPVKPELVAAQVREPHPAQPQSQPALI